MASALKENLESVRRATDESQKLLIRYKSLKDDETERVIWPMMLYFWGNKWTLGAWYELRQDFRSFRIDLINIITQTEKHYEHIPGRDIESYIAYQSERDW